MKFIQIEPSNAHGNPNLFIMHCGREEMELLYGLCLQAKHHIPLIERYKPDMQRIRNILKSLKKVLNK